MAEESNADRVPWRRYAQLLAGSGLDDESIEQLMAAISRLSGLRVPFRVFPIGIPAWDGLAARVELSPDDLGSFTAQILRDELLRNVEIFPIGIPQTEVFQATVSFG